MTSRSTSLMPRLAWTWHQRSNVYLRTSDCDITPSVPSVYSTCIGRSENRRCCDVCHSAMWPGQSGAPSIGLSLRRFFAPTLQPGTEHRIPPSFSLDMHPS